jgi:multidrug resistance protein
MIAGLRRSPVALVAAVSAALFADSLLYSAVVPVLPEYAHRHGASTLAIGVLFACYAVGLLVATAPFAALSDRYGRRLPLLLGMLGVTGATLLFALADSYPGLVLARSLQGVAAAAVWTSGVAWLADRIEPGRLGSAMGVATASMSAGLLVGPPAAGFLAEQGGFRLPFLVAAALTALAGIIQLLPAPAVEPRVRSTGFRGLRTPTVIRTLVAVALAASALSFLEPTLPLDLARRFAASPAVIGLLFGVATLAHLLSAPAAGYLSDRHPRDRLLRIGLAGMALVLPLIALAPGEVAVAAVLVGFAVAYSFVLVPALPELAAVVRDSPTAGYAAAYAVFNIAYAVGMVLGPVAGTAALSVWPTLAVLGGIAIVLLAASVALRVRLPTHSPIDPAAQSPSSHPVSPHRS